MNQPGAELKPFRNSAEYNEKKECLAINDSESIWRYMDYFKFISLIKENALYFCRIDNFSDKYEGTFAKTNLETQIFPQIPNSEGSIIEKDRKLIHEAAVDIMRLIYVNCFTIRSSESPRMWEEYTTDSNSVVIKSSFLSLKKSFTRYEGDNGVFTEMNISKVNYVDYDSHFMPEWSVLIPFIHKKKDFEFEQELRLFATIPDIDMAVGQCNSELLETKGSPSIAEYLHLGVIPDYPSLLISVDPNILIEQVIVHPDSTGEFIEKVRNDCKIYGLNAEVVRSSLTDN